MFVIDTSVALSWLIPDEFNVRSNALLQLFYQEGFHVPHVWPSEVANGLATCVRQKRIESADLDKTFRMLDNLQFSVDTRPQDMLIERHTQLALKTGLSAYDASYIDLALHTHYPLASFDRKLCDAARRMGISLWEA